MPPPRGSPAGLGHTSRDAGGERLSVSEVQDIAADITAQASRDAWVATVQRWQPRLEWLYNHTTTIAKASPVLGMWRSAADHYLYKRNKMYTLSDQELIINALSAALACGLRLLFADEALWSLLRDKDGTSAGESVKLLAMLITRSLTVYGLDLHHKKHREVLPAGTLAHAAELLETMVQFGEKLAATMEQWTADERASTAGAVFYDVIRCLLNSWGAISPMLETVLKLDKDTKLMAMLSLPVMCRVALLLLQGPGDMVWEIVLFITRVLSWPASREQANALAKQQARMSPHVHKFMTAVFTVLAHEAGRQRRTHAYAWAEPLLTQQQQQQQQQQQLTEHQQQQRQRRSGTRAAAAAATGTNSAAAAVNRTDSENTQPDAAQAAAAAAAAAKASGRLIKAPSGAVALKALLQLGCSAKTARAMRAAASECDPFMSSLFVIAERLLCTWAAAADNEEVQASANATNSTTTSTVTMAVASSSSSSSSSSNADANARYLAASCAQHCMTRDDAHWLLCACGQAAQAALVGCIDEWDLGELDPLYGRTKFLACLLLMAVSVMTDPPHRSVPEAPSPVAQERQCDPGCTAVQDAAAAAAAGSSVSSSVAACSSGECAAVSDAAAAPAAPAAARALAFACAEDDSGCNSSSAGGDTSSSSSSSSPNNRTSISRWCTEPPQLQDVAVALLLDIGPVLVDVVTESMSKTGGDYRSGAVALVGFFAVASKQLFVPDCPINPKEFDKQKHDLAGVVVSAPLTAARVLELALRAVNSSSSAGPADAIQWFSCRVAMCVNAAACQSDGFGALTADAQARALLLPQLATLLLSVLKEQYAAVHSSTQQYAAAVGECEDSHDVLIVLNAASIWGTLEVFSAACLLVLPQQGAPQPDSRPDAARAVSPLMLLVALRALLLLGNLLQYKGAEMVPAELWIAVRSTVYKHLIILQQQLLLREGGGSCLLPPLRDCLCSVDGDDRSSSSSSSSNQSSSTAAHVASTRTAVTTSFEALQSALAGMQQDEIPCAQQAMQLGRLVALFAEPALALLPSPLCCNNPACVNLEETAEWQLVNRPGSVCAGCRTARYCCADCQRAHWAAHKPVCKALKEALAGGGYEPTPGYVGVSRVLKL